VLQLGVHQGSELFIIEIEALPSSFKQNFPWDFLYVDDLPGGGG